MKSLGNRLLSRDVFGGPKCDRNMFSYLSYFVLDNKLSLNENLDIHRVKALLREGIEILKI